MQYACRKTLADSRPRVRGRFAKNDDFGDTHRTASSNHEEEDEEEVRFLQHIQLLKPTNKDTFCSTCLSQKNSLSLTPFIGCWHDSTIQHFCAYR